MAKKTKAPAKAKVEVRQVCSTCFHYPKDHMDVPCHSCFGVRMEKRFAYKNWKLGDKDG